MKLRVDLETCRKNGQCYYLHPDLMTRGTDDHPRVVAEDVPKEQQQDAEDMADICPTASIPLSTADGG